MSEYQSSGLTGMIARISGELKSTGRMSRADLKSDPASVDGVRGLADQLLISELHVGDDNATIFCDVNGDPVATFNSSGSHSIGIAGQALTVPGSLSVAQDATFSGNVYVNGGTIQITSEVSLNHDNLIVVSSGPGSVQDGGLLVEQFYTAWGTPSSTGTAQAGAASTITLASIASAAVGYSIAISANTGVGQQRTITAYNTGTKVATVDRAWDVNPDATSQYQLFATPNRYAGVIWDAGESEYCFAATASDVGEGQITFGPDLDVRLASLNATVNAAIAGTLSVVGVSSLASLNISGALDVDGASTLAALSLSGVLDVDGAATLASATIEGALAVSGTSTLTGNVSAVADASVGGNLAVTGTSAFTGNLSTVAAASIGGALSVTGTSAFTGNLSTVAAASIGGALSVTGISTLTGNVSAVADASVGANLSVTGTSAFTGNLSTVAAASIGGALSVTGISTLTGNVSAVADASIGGNLAVTGNSTFSGTAAITGVATMTAGFDSNAASYASNLTIDGADGSRYVVLTSNSTISPVTANASIYVEAGELYYREDSGNITQITADGALNVGEIDTTNITGTASASYTINTDAVGVVDEASLILRSGGSGVNVDAGSLAYVFGANGSNNGVWSLAAHAQIADDKALRLGSDADVAISYVSASAMLYVDASAAGKSFDLQSHGNVTIDSSDGAISIGNDANAGAISIGTGAAARSITLGNLSDATAILYRAGSGGHAWIESGLSNSATNAPAAVNDVVFMGSDGLSKADAAAFASSFAQGAYTNVAGEVRTGRVSFSKMATNVGGTAFDNISKGDVIWLSAAIANEYDAGVTPAKGRCSNRAPVANTAGSVNFILGIAAAASSASTPSVQLRQFCPQYVSTN